MNAANRGSVRRLHAQLLAARNTLAEAQRGDCEVERVLALSDRVEDIATELCALEEVLMGDSGKPTGEDDAIVRGVVAGETKRDVRRLVVSLSARDRRTLRRHRLAELGTRHTGGLNQLPLYRVRRALNAELDAPSGVEWLVPVLYELYRRRLAERRLARRRARKSRKSPLSEAERAQRRDAPAARRMRAHRRRLWPKTPSEDGNQSA